MKILVAVDSIIDDEAYLKAEAIGVNLRNGHVNKTHHRFVLNDAGSFPETHADGGALRSRVIWWIYTGESPGPEFDIHHKNENRLDDRFKNLEKLDHIKHSKLHNPSGGTLIDRICVGCGATFQIPQWRIKDTSRGKFCSGKCYQLFPKKNDHARVKCVQCGSIFETTKFRAKKRRFCSHSCSATSQWRTR